MQADLVSLPLKQGLKRNLLWRAALKNSYLVSLPLKQGLKLWHSFVICVYSTQDLVSLPLKQGLKQDNKIQNKRFDYRFSLTSIETRIETKVN